MRPYRPGLVNHDLCDRPGHQNPVLVFLSPLVADSTFCRAILTLESMPGLRCLESAQTQAGFPSSDRLHGWAVSGLLSSLSPEPLLPSHHPERAGIPHLLYLNLGCSVKPLGQTRVSSNPMWWHMPVFFSLRKLRQENLEFTVRLCFFFLFKKKKKDSASSSW